MNEAFRIMQRFDDPHLAQGHVADGRGSGDTVGRTPILDACALFTAEDLRTMLGKEPDPDVESTSVPVDHRPGHQGTPVDTDNPTGECRREAFRGRPGFTFGYYVHVSVEHAPSRYEALYEYHAKSLVFGGADLDTDAEYAKLCTFEGTRTALFMSVPTSSTSRWTSTTSRTAMRSWRATTSRSPR